MLSEEMTGRLVNEIRRFLIADAATLSKANDEQLRRRIADIVDHKLVNYRISPQERSRIVRLVFSSIRGMGILDEILADDSITEIMINGPFHIFVERAGRLEALNKKFASENELRNIIQKMVGSVGKEVNEANPIVDTRLADGSRVNVVLPPLSLSGPIVTIRKFSRTPMTVDQLLKYGSITPEAADFLGKLVRAKYNIFISGGTGSGKTTFLNAMSNFIPRDERIITIEDSAELQIANIDNIVSLETRNANTSGKGEVTIRDLIKSALRMRPERIIVGEVRGAEALDMLQAMNTGHLGSMSTLHANSPRDALLRLEMMVTLTGFRSSETFIRKVVSSAVDMIVQVIRLPSGKRVISEIVEVTDVQTANINTQTLFQYVRTKRQFKALKDPSEELTVKLEEQIW